jgi:hypothetical protein
MLNSLNSLNSLNYTLRLFAFIILFALVIINDIPFKKIYKEPIIQLYLAIVCLFILMFIDNISGFIITLGLLTLYFRIYSEEIKQKKELARLEEEAIKKEKEKNEKSNKGDKGGDKCTMDAPCHKKSKDLSLLSNGSNGSNDSNERPYITEENLLAAQTNIVDVDNYNNEVGSGSNGSNGSNGSDYGAVTDNISTSSKLLYRSQGLNNNNSHIRGYDINNVYLGSLNYELL